MDERDEYINFRMAEGASYDEAAAEYDEGIEAQIRSEQAAERGMGMWCAFPGDRADAGADDPRSY